MWANSSHEEAAASHRQGTQTEGCCQNSSTPLTTSLEVTQVCVGMSENRTKGTPYPCVVSGILNSEWTELPANGGLCLCPSSHGEPARPAILVFSCNPSHPEEGGDKGPPLPQSFCTLLHGNQLPMPQPREYELSAAITCAMLGDAGRSTGSDRSSCSGLELSRSQ